MAIVEYPPAITGDGTGDVVATNNPQANDLAHFTGANSIEGKTYAETLVLLSGKAGTAFDMNSQKITSLADPANDQDAATKAYVDEAAGGVTSHPELSNRSDADQHPASSITNTPAGDIAATDIQAAINELDTEKEPVISTKNTAFNKDFGTTNDTVCEGNDSRLSDARTPTAHDNTYHSETYITSGSVTKETLDTNGDIETTITDTNDKLPTSGAVVDYVAANSDGATIWTSWTGASRDDDTTISSTSHLTIGTAVRYRATDGTWRYGRVTAISTDAHSIQGWPVTTSDDDEFQYDAANIKTEAQTIHFSGNFNDADNDTLITTDLLMKAGFIPGYAGELYLVGISAVCDSADTSADPDVNIVIHGGTNKILNSDLAVNETLANSATVETTGGYYALDGDSALDVSVDKNGAGDAYDMDIILYFVRA